MRCVVTGGAGFIGSHVVERLLELGHAVVAVDNLSSGSVRNVEHLRSNPRFSFLQFDIADEGLEKEIKEVDWFFHLAALADIVPSIEAPYRYHRSNVDGTMRCLEVARMSGVRRFIYAASSSCYGIPDLYPTPETAPARPQYPYALTKYVGEQYVLHWHQVYGLPAVSLRFFNVYGPRARTSGTYGAVFGVFLAQKLSGLPMTIVGDGTQTRDFTYVTDVADACIAVADTDISGRVFNIGSGNTYSVNSLVELLGGESTYIPKRPGEPDCTFADISRIKTEVGWAPKVSFPEGVERMLTHIEDWRGAPQWTVDRIADATKDWFKYLGKQA